MPDEAKQIRVAVAIIQEGGRFLITRRPAHVDLPNLWEFPGGKIEPGEFPEATAVREVQEELAITAIPTGRLQTIVHRYPHAEVTLYPILCQRTAGDPQAIECTEFRWVTREELQALPFPEANSTLLRSLLQQDLQV